MYVIMLAVLYLIENAAHDELVCMAIELQSKAFVQISYEIEEQ